MPYINFKANGVPLWAEYKYHDYDDIEILSITTAESNVDILPVIDENVISLAIDAAEQDQRDLLEYQRECQLEMREAARND